VKVNSRYWVTLAVLGVVYWIVLYLLAFKSRGFVNVLEFYLGITPAGIWGITIVVSWQIMIFFYKRDKSIFWAMGTSLLAIFGFIIYGIYLISRINF